MYKYRMWVHARETENAQIIGNGTRGGATDKRRGFAKRKLGSWIGSRETLREAPLSDNTSTLYRRSSVVVKAEPHEKAACASP